MQNTMYGRKTRKKRRLEEDEKRNGRELPYHHDDWMNYNFKVDAVPKQMERVAMYGTQIWQERRSDKIDYLLGYIGGGGVCSYCLSH